MARKPAIADRRVALTVGWGLFALGAWVLYDAYDGRGIRTPWPLGAVMPW